MKRISCTEFLAITAALLLAPCVSLPAQGQSVAAPAIELGAPFRDSAILQREMPVPVWGWSKQGATVTVEFAGQKESAKAGADGKWMLNLKPLTASAEPAEMAVNGSDGNKSVLKNILVGEVWHASGQSNMEWFSNKSNCMALAQELSKAEEEVPIRELRTDTMSALYPQERVTSEQGWKSSREAGGFSALALSFAHTLHQELKVPVGILLTSHSNTRAEAFAQREAFEKHPQLKTDGDLIHDGDVTTGLGRAAFDRFYQPPFPCLRSGHRLFQRPLHSKQIPSSKAITP